MKKLVSPEHIVYFVNSRDELKELVRRLRIDEKLAGNLRQLLVLSCSGRGFESGGDAHRVAILPACSPTSATVK